METQFKEDPNRFTKSVKQVTHIDGRTETQEMEVLFLLPPPLPHHFHQPNLLLEQIFHYFKIYKDYEHCQTK